MANIKINNNEYPIPDSILAGPRADFVAHLGTIAGNGLKVVVGGVEYGVDATKVAGAFEAFEGALCELHVEPSIAGLYSPGAIALYEEQGAEAIEGMMITSWDDLLANGTVHVEDGAVSSNWNEDDWENPSSDDLAGELILPNDGSITAIGNGYIDEDWNYIGSFGFYGCESLSRILLPKSVVSMCHGAFCNCYALESIEIPATITSISSEAFMYCEALASVGFAEGSQLTLVDHDAFYACESLTNIAIPEGVTIIGNCAFQRCTNLMNITIPDSVVYFGDQAFADCPGFDQFIQVENGISYVGKSVIACDRSVSNVVLRDNTLGISFEAFQDCPIASITIPDSVTIIGDRAFSSCENLASITIPYGVTKIGADAFAYCANLTDVIIPDSVTFIGSSAFMHCLRLTSITIPDSVTIIPNDTFFWCKGLTSVTIPESVISIGETVFHACAALTSICYNGTTAQWNAITKGDNWNSEVPATYVQCSDGQVAL